jgi:D-glycero-alpha-D-manno-heptose-7-phosphate kinase
VRECLERLNLRKGMEIEKLKEPIGKQDQYIAAYGGLQLIRFQPDGHVCVNPVVCPVETKRELNRRLVVFYTGKTRSAREVLTRQRANAGQRRSILLARAAALRRECSIGLTSDA